MMLDIHQEVAMEKTDEWTMELASGFSNVWRES